VVIDINGILLWITTNVFVATNLIQVGFVVAVYFILWILYKKVLHVKLEELIERHFRKNAILHRVSDSFDEILVAFLATIIFGSVAAILASSHVIDIFMNLTMAWIIIRLSTTVVKNKLLAKTIAFITWTYTALNITNLLAPTTAILAALSFSIGTTTITALLIINGIFTVSVMLWLSIVISNGIAAALKSSKDITPSVRILISKIIKFILITIAIFASLNFVGIDLTVFAVFSGALGVGIGLGLQKPTANIISGVILLLDKSIKPNDVVELMSSNNKNHGKFGIVKKMGARYTEVVDRNGRAHIIPNEDFLNSRVVNYSHGNTKNKKQIRREIFFITSNKVDPAAVKSICEKAAAIPNRVLNTPEPACHMRGFNGYSLEWKLRFWITDPHNGVSNITGLVYTEIWNALAANNIEVPDPEQVMFISKESDRDEWNPADISESEIN